MSAPELKPCPFCGGDVEMNDYTEKPAVAWVLIHRCSVIGPIKITGFRGTELAREWNTRADLCDPLSDPRVAALVSALEDAVEAWEIHEESGDMMQAYWLHDAREALAALRQPD